MQKWSQGGRMFDSFFFRTFMDLDLISVDKTQKKKPNKQTKNSANIQPSWPHPWSITHTYPFSRWYLQTLRKKMTDLSVN